MFKSGFFHVFGFCLMLLASLSVAESSTYFIPYYARDNGVATGAGLRNLSTSSVANVTIQVYSETGSLLETQQVQVVPNGQWSGIVGNNASLEGWFQVESDQHLAGLCFVAKDNCMMDVPITETLSKKLIIPHVAQNSIWDTIVYIANPNEQTASGTIQFLNISGDVIADQSISIPRMGSEQIFLSDVKGEAGAAEGSVFIQLNHRIAGFALYHNRKIGQYSYAGINAVPLEVSEFDGTWIESAYEGNADCCDLEMPLSFEVYKNNIQGTFVNPVGQLMQMKGDVEYGGDISGIIYHENNEEGSFSGNVTGDRMELKISYF